MSPPAQARRCLVVVPSLARGGAERQAVLTALALRERGLDMRLFVQGAPDSLARDGLTEKLACDMPASSPGPLADVLRLRRAVEAFAPNAVITFLRGAD